MGRRSRKPESSATLGAVNWPLTRRRAVDLCRVGSCLCGSHCLARVHQLGLQPGALLLAEVRSVHSSCLALRQLLASRLQLLHKRLLLILQEQRGKGRADWSGSKP